MDLVIVGGEMDDGSPAFLEKGCVGVPIRLVLSYRILPRLAGHRVFQLAGSYWNPVEGEYQVNGVARD